LKINSNVLGGQIIPLDNPTEQVVCVNTSVRMKVTNGSGTTMEENQEKAEDQDIFSLVRKPLPISEKEEEYSEVEKPKKRIRLPEIFEEPYLDDEKEEESEPEEEVQQEEELEDEDYDFDFSVYESEDKEIDEIPDSILKTTPPVVSGFRSRFSHGSFELERLGELKKQCSSYAIKVAAYKQDISMLREYYGILRTMWMIIKPIYGKYQWDEFDELSALCRNALNSVSSSMKINEEVFETLLSFDAQMQRLMQLSNLGFEVEKWGQGSRASKQIIQ